MRFFSLLFAGVAVASLCLSSFAQTTNTTANTTANTSAAPQQQTAPAAAPAPSSQPVPQLKLEDLPRDPHTPTPEEQAEQEAARQRAQIMRAASAQANWGPKAGTPGITLALKETARTKTDAGTEITYRLTATGFAPGTRLTLLRWPLNQVLTALMDGIVLDSSGTAVCAGPVSALNADLNAPGAATPGSGGGSSAAAKTPGVASCSKTMTADAPVEITTTAARGEAIRVALLSEDKKSGGATSVVPFPLTGENNGCKLDLLLGSKDAELVLIEGDGFKTDLPFTLGAETFGQKTMLAAKPDAQGHFVAAVTPYLPGHDSGDTVIFYQSEACTPTLSFHWGKGSYKTE
jgi:hypothetical protein